MPTARLVGRVVASVVALLLVACVVLGLVAVGAARRSLPTTSGTLTVRGLTGVVDVVRNAQGVPDVYADSPEDLFLAQGYVDAQDRFFQMDLRRHVTAGRLAELVGESGVETDKVVRTLGWRRVAQAELPQLSASTRRYLQAYADGVNAYLDERGSPGSVAVEYLLLGTRFPGYEIERWDEVDSLAWLKAMAWDLNGGDDKELARAQMLADGVPLATVRQLYPTTEDPRHAPILGAGDWQAPPSLAPTTPRSVLVGAAPEAVGGHVTGSVGGSPGRATTRPATGTTTTGTTTDAGAPTPGTAPARPDAATGAVLASARSALAAVRPLVGSGEGIGSNAWVVSGRRSTTGKPLLANDPHLGLTMPSVWHQVGLHCRTVRPECPYDVTGFGFAGLPGVVIGRTQGVAWGFTNLDPDVSDFYLERVEGSRVRRGTTTEPLAVRTETISVAGGADVTLTVRSTSHGPIVSDVLAGVRPVAAAPADGAPPGEPAVALAWTGLVPGRNADALFALDRARTGDDVRAAMELFSAPGQNCVYADTTGRIGYQAPGLVPVRAAVRPGTPPGWLPAPGWDTAYDWQGYVPFASMPHVEDPAEGLVVTANQEVTPSTPPYLTTDWTPGWRADRIRAVLTAQPRISPDTMRAAQTDTASAFGPLLARALLAVPVDDGFVAEGQQVLRGWDGSHPTGTGAASRAAMYLETVWREIVGLVITPRVGSHAHVDGGSHWASVVAGILDEPRNGLWDDPSTPAIETRDSVLLEAMTRARSTLTRTQGKDPDRWSWERAHTITVEHPLGPALPGLLGGLVNRGPYPAPGSVLAPNAFGGDLTDDGFAVTHGPSMRMVVDLSAPDSSTWVASSGVSGHLADGRYDDQLDAWLQGRTYPWRSTAKAVDAAAEERLRLEPDPAGS